MANWNNPSGNTTSYLDVLDELKARDVDALSLLKATGTNVPNGAIRFVREANNKVTIQERINNAWVDKIISIDSGGFDSGTDASLGTMASQNSDNVTITGGSVASSTLSGGISLARIPNLPANRTTSGIFGLARIPSLPASRINSGTFNANRIPSLPTSRITSGQFSVNRIPSLPVTIINSGTFGLDRIPNLPASRVNSGTFGANRIPSLPVSKIPNLPASIINSGTLNNDRLSSIPRTALSMASGTSIRSCRVSSGTVRQQFSTPAYSLPCQYAYWETDDCRKR